MAMSLTSVTRPKPGRFDDTLGMIAEVAKLLERHGSADNRALVGGIAGEETGNIAFTSEFATGEQLGATVDALLADAEYAVVAEPCERGVRTRDAVEPLGRERDPARVARARPPEGPSSRSTCRG